MIFKLSKFICLFWVVLLVASKPTSAQSLDERPLIVGAQKAPIKLDLYFSFSCPHCLNFIDKNQKTISYNVLNGNLQIRYLEMPEWMVMPQRTTKETHERAKKLSRQISSVIQCIGQSTNANYYGLIFTTFPERLKREIGQTQALVPDSAPSLFRDWHYWVWSDTAATGPDTLPIRILKQHKNNIPKRIDCEPEKLLSVFQHRMKGLPQTGRTSVPSFLVNDEPIPAKQNQLYFKNIETILANTDRLSDIVKSSPTLIGLSAKQNQLLSGSSIKVVNQAEKHVRLKGPNGTQTIQFNRDAVNLLTYDGTEHTYQHAPLLEFLFFGTGISQLQSLDIILARKNTIIIQLYDQHLNLLQVSLEGKLMSFGKYKSFIGGSRITSFIYSPNDPKDNTSLGLSGG